MPDNRLFFGDNLEVLRKSPHVGDDSVDLVYLDPPFNSNRAYNVLFGHKTGEDAQAQIQAFGDTWTWSQEADRQYRALLAGEAPPKVADAIEGMRKVLGDNDVFAYLVMMTPRLVELHKKLKPTGSMYLHCDPVASHYLKVMLDALFGPEHFRNEIIWRRTGAHGKVRRYGPIHDVILFYTKSDDYKWNYPTRPYMEGHVKEYFVQDEKGWRTNYYGNVLTGSGVRGGESGQTWKGFNPTAKGRHWAIPGALVDELGEDLSALSQHQKLDRLLELGLIRIVPGQAWPMYERYVTPSDGTPVSDIWAYQPYTEGTVFGTEEGVDADVRWLGTRDQERLGYQTQKPVSLLKRIIAASSDPGDIVLDPFCGCGTTIEAAHELGRHWIGIDITYIAIDLIQKRLRRYGSAAPKYIVEGKPRDLGGAKALFAKSPFEFQRWAVSPVDATPNEKPSGDKGIDGIARFTVDARGGTGRALVSVKGGATGPGDVRDLVGTVESQRAEMGIFITLEPPTPGMMDAARHSGTYTHPISGREYPRVQILTVEELLHGKKPDMPTPLLPYIRGVSTMGEEQLTLKMPTAARRPRKVATAAAPAAAATPVRPRAAPKP